MKDEIRVIRTRKKLHGSNRVRLSVVKSNKYIYAQAVDLTGGVTLAQAHGKKAEDVGQKVAMAMIKKGIKNIVFDRGSYKYHGQVKSLAEAARAAGLEF